MPNENSTGSESLFLTGAVIYMRLRSDRGSIGTADVSSIHALRHANIFAFIVFASVSDKDLMGRKGKIIILAATVVLFFAFLLSPIGHEMKFIYRLKFSDLKYHSEKYEAQEVSMLLCMSVCMCAYLHKPIYSNNRK